MLFKHVLPLIAGTIILNQVKITFFLA